MTMAAPEKKRVVRVKRGVAKRVLPNFTAHQQKMREKEQKALELRKARVGYRQIAETLGYSNESGAYKAVQRAIKRQGYELASDVLSIDLAMLDEMQMRVTERIRTTGDLRYIDQLLRLMERRYSLVGINARTVDELREKMGLPSQAQERNTLGSITNNGVMVIQGSTEAEFVRNMMEATGVDPESPAAQQKLKEIEARAETAQARGASKKKSTGTKSGKAGGTDTPSAGKPYIDAHIGGSNSEGSSTPDIPVIVESDISEIVDAEIVDDDE